jgi:hypothetical protein
MVTILWYSTFTFPCCLSAKVWQLGLFRMLRGIGIGGEWAMEGTFVAEEWPEDRRKIAAGWMHTGYYAGLFLAALANYFLGARYGWRVMFAIGELSALLVGSIRYGVTDSARWRSKAQQMKKWSVGHPFEDFILERISAAHVVERDLCSGVDDRVVGRIGDVPAAISEIAARKKVPAAVDLARDKAPFRHDDSGMYRSAIYSGTHREPGDARGLFCVHDGVNCHWVRLRFLSCTPLARLVFCFALVPGIGRR